MKDVLNLLITSVGRRSYIVEYFKAAIGGRGEVHAANSVMTYAMQLADHAVVTPMIYAEGYIDTLLSYCRDWRIDAVLSLLDIDIPILAANRDRFRETGVAALVPSSETALICNDKWRTAGFLRGQGIKTPASFLTLGNCRQALASGEVDFPLVVKPRWGMGSIGIFHAENAEELDVFYEKTKREIGRSYLKYESRQDLEHCVIIQQKLAGEEYGLNVLNDLDGRFLTCVPMKKLAMRAGETDAAEIVADHELQRLGRKLSESLGHVGNLDVDCFRAEGACCVLELNCRFGGQYPFVHLAGGDFPGALVAMLRHETVPARMLVARPGVIGYKDLRPVVLHRSDPGGGSTSPRP
ncbi:MAG: ATP-grasp domain-containing protein [Acidobacteria bacterium]|nr:ATP-grasp domain-containing protein [Acidobacteriota bacterium]